IEADAPEPLLGGRQAPSQRPPRRAAVSRLVQPAILALPGAIFPRPLARLEQDGVDRLRIARIERQRHAAGVLVLVQHALPILAAVNRAINAALLVGAVGMAKHGDEDTV